MRSAVLLILSAFLLSLPVPGDGCPPKSLVKITKEGIKKAIKNAPKKLATNIKKNPITWINSAVSVSTCITANVYGATKENCNDECKNYNETIKKTASSIDEIVEATKEDIQKIEELLNITTTAIELSKNLSKVFNNLANSMEKIKASNQVFLRPIKEATDDYKNNLNKDGEAKDELISKLETAINIIEIQITKEQFALDTIVQVLEFGGMGSVTASLIGTKWFQKRILENQREMFQATGRIIDSTELTNEAKTTEVIKFLKTDKSTKTLEKIKALKVALKTVKNVFTATLLGVCSAQIYIEEKTHAEIVLEYRNASDHYQNLEEKLNNSSIEIKQMLQNLTADSENLLSTLKKQYELIFTAAGKDLCLSSQSSECGEFFKSGCSLDIGDDNLTFVGHMQELNKDVEIAYNNFTIEVERRQKIEDQLKKAAEEIPKMFRRYKRGGTSLGAEQLCIWLQEDFPESKDQVCDTIYSSALFPNLTNWTESHRNECSAVDCTIIVNYVCPGLDSVCVGSNSRKLPCPGFCVPQSARTLDITFRRTIEKHCKKI